MKETSKAIFKVIQSDQVFFNYTETIWQEFKTALK